MRKTFPWYDSIWLSNYVNAKNFIRENYPNKLKDFVDAFQPLQTRKDFEVIKLKDFLSSALIEQSKNLIRDLKDERKEAHELMRMGRVVVHNDDFFNQIQASITPQVSELVKEEVEATYNFLSLYYNLGVCKVHMDAPNAKYTVDICIEQSTDWKIYISQRRDWAEDFEQKGKDWQAQILNDPTNHFQKYSLSPGSGIIFSGSSQWHYRNRIFDAEKVNFCHLIFFHFTPKGMKEIVRCENWAELFDLPELDNLIQLNY
jgi:hypothetical protein